MSFVSISVILDRRHALLITIQEGDHAWSLAESHDPLRLRLEVGRCETIWSGE
jgi:hypothetical protein